MAGWLITSSVCLAFAPVAAAQPARSAPLEGFLERKDAPVVSYRAMRHMEARSERLNADGWIDVLTELSPEHGLTFEVLREGGSGYIRNKVLRAMLKREAEAIANGDPDRAAPTQTNYDFTADESLSTDGLVRVTARPKRKDVLLVKGVFFLNEAGELVRVEGELTKSPSFWTHDVQIIRHYGRVCGIRVPLSFESVAQVRIAGESVLKISYQYEHVNGQPVASEIARAAVVH